MKTSVAVMAAAATLAMAKPSFLNTNFDITAGQEFVLKFAGCEEGCDIQLLKGDPKDLDVVQDIVKDTTGTEELITLSAKFPTDKYAFRIVDSDGEVNYSEQFDFEGAAPAETTSAEETSSTPESTSAEETTEETTMVTVTTESDSESTPETTTTESESPTTTDEDSASQTTDDEDVAPVETDAAIRLGAPYVGFAAAVAALVGYVL